MIRRINCYGKNRYEVENYIINSKKPYVILRAGRVFGTNIKDGTLITDILKDMNLKYKYEPLVKAGGKHFFPDFLINNKIIIECTGWRGYDKAIKLKKKIRYLKKRYKVYVVIPKTLKRYYEILNRHLILGTDNLSNIIQKSE